MNQIEAGVGPLTLRQISTALTALIPDTAPSKKASNTAAVSMILRQGDSGLDTLFIQRAEHPHDPWSGHMAFPGGRKEPLDDSLEAAAIRETKEEVGIRLHSGMQIGRLHDIEGGRLTERQLAVSAFVFYHPGSPVPAPNVHEVADTVWIPLEFLSRPENVLPHVVAMDPLRREFPAFHYENYVVWGLTYRIIANFVHALGIELPGEPRVTNIE